MKPVENPSAGAGATATLARWMAGLRLEDLPPEVVEHVKCCLIDTLACGLGGRRTADADALVALSRRTGGTGGTGGTHTIFGEAQDFGLLQAAQANRVLINILDYDDTVIGTGHMSSVAVAAALAIGEQVRADGRALLTALALAYEMPLRLRLAVNPTLEAFRANFERVDSGVHFCATVATARLLGLDATGMADALGLTGHLRPWHVTSPPMSTHGMSRWFKITQGDTVVAGMQAALLAQQGIEGDRTIFDQDRCYAAHVGSDRYDSAPLERGREGEYLLLGIGFKAQPCCRHISAFADALAKLRDEHGVDLPSLARVRVLAHMWTHENLAIVHPQHMIGAQFSMAHALAMVMLGLPPGPAWYSEEALFGQQARALRERVEMVHDAQAQRHYDVEKRYAGTIEVQTEGGGHLRSHVGAPKGAAGWPFTEQDHRDKLFALAEQARLSRARTQRLWNLLRHVERLADVRELTALLVPG